MSHKISTHPDIIRGNKYTLYGEFPHGEGMDIRFGDAFYLRTEYLSNILQTEGRWEIFYGLKPYNKITESELARVRVHSNNLVIEKEENVIIAEGPIVGYSIYGRPLSELNPLMLDSLQDAKKMLTDSHEKDSGEVLEELCRLFPDI